MLISPVHTWTVVGRDCLQFGGWIGVNKLLRTGSFVRLRHNTVDRVFSLLERGRVHDRTSLLFILFY